MAFAQASLSNIAEANIILDKIMTAALADPDRHSEDGVGLNFGLNFATAETDTITYTGCLYLHR